MFPSRFTPLRFASTTINLLLYFTGKKFRGCCYRAFSPCKKNRMRHLLSSISASESTRPFGVSCAVSRIQMSGALYLPYCTQWDKHLVARPDADKLAIISTHENKSLRKRTAWVTDISIGGFSGWWVTRWVTIGYVEITYNKLSM